MYSYNEYLRKVNVCCKPGPQGIQGYQGIQGPTGPTGPASETGIAPLTETIILYPSPIKTILNAENYFSKSWRATFSSDLILDITFSNFLVNGIYTFYLYNFSGLRQNITLASSSSIIKSNVSYPIIVPDKEFYMFNILYYNDGANSYYFICAIGNFY